MAQKLKEALAGPAKDKKEPAVADGILSVTPDPPEAAEWRKSVLDTIAADSSFPADDEAGKRPNELFGKFTWKIENFSEIGKRELRSSRFDVGEYKWYILVYPAGCDVCNHLSLFLCVADYDKLLPGWSHFAQFTIAVVNKDPKKSKYSDTLHRFCKKEHDWGWKKFMELNKVLDGFTVSDTLVIKAQVQVILDRPSKPFRCLDAQYRRELVRVYLTNVESICRRFCEDRRQRLSWLREEGSSFSAWWRTLAAERRKQLTTEKGESILKGVVKQFFNEKEVTSTLVMDALYCGCRQLECLSRKKGMLPEGSSAPCVVINGKALTFSFALDALEVIAQLSQDFLPPLPNDKVLPVCADGLGLRSGCDEMSELRRDALERDEKRLAELGRRTVEMYALAHIFTERLERAYRDHQAEKRMKDLIAEEEEAGRLEDERAAARAAADKEKRAKKKERKKAKKEADKAKRDAEEAERAAQEQAKLAEIERRVAEANERRKQEELDAAAQQQKQHQQQQQQHEKKQQHSKAAHQKQHQQQQHLANGDCSTAEDGPSSNGNASSTGHGHGKQQQQHASSAAMRAASFDTDVSAGPSSSDAAAAGSTGHGVAAGGKYSSSSSPAAPASVTDDASEVTSTSDLDDSSSMEVGSSSKGFTPVVGRHSHQLHLHHTQQQQQVHAGAAAGSGPVSARGPGRPMHQAGAVSGGQQSQQNHSQQQQQQTGSIPTGYAAAVAGMRPPPPAEVVSAAAALADQARRVRQLEEEQQALQQQVTTYKAQVEGLETSLADRDASLARKEQQLTQQEALLAQRDASIAQKDAALSQRDQELQELRKQAAAQQQQLVSQQQQLSELRALQAKTVNELRAAQAVNAAANATAMQASSRGSSKDGGGGRKVSAGSEDGAWLGAGSSGRPRGQSVDLTSSADALASSSSIVAGPSPSAAAAPWAAVAAGTSSSLRDSGTASSSGSQELVAAAAAAATANGPSAAALHEQRSVAGSCSSSVSGADAGLHAGSLSYAESLSGLLQVPASAGGSGGGASQQHHTAPPGLHSHAPGVSTPRAQASAAADGTASAGPGPGSSSGADAAGSTAVRGQGSTEGPGDRLAGSRQRQGPTGKGPVGGAAGSGSPAAASDAGSPRAVGGSMGRNGSPGLGDGRAAGSSSSGGLDPTAGPSAHNMHGSIGRAGASRFTSTAPQQQQQQYGGGMPSSSNRHAEGAHRGPDRLGAGLGKGIHQGAAGAAAAGPGSYLSNGIAGVLHSSVPTNSSSPSSHAPLHSYRNAAAAPGAGSSAAAGMGPSSIAAMGAGGGAGGGGMTGMLGSMQQGGAVGAKAGGSNLAGGKVPGGLTAQQHPFAYAGNMAGGSRPMHGFAPVAAGAAKGPNDTSAATQRSASASSMAMDDAGLDGFVHMHMIDDLLTE